MIVNRGPMNIVIVGIAGLSLAIGLKQRGLTARVYETAPEVKELGIHRGKLHCILFEAAREQLGAENK